MSDSWFKLSNEHEVPSPSLLIYPDRVEENIRRLIQLVGDVSRVRPHVKTHKLPQIIALKLRHGITRFKAATIAEAEMVAQEGGPDVFLAYQPVGPNCRRMTELVRKFPSTRFSTMVDNLGSVTELNQACQSADVVLDVFLDLNSGMNRTGIPAGPEAMAVYRAIHAASNLRAAGLHAYDGHLHERDPVKLRASVEASFAPIEQFLLELRNAGLPADRIIAGGTPTTPLHAAHGAIECGAGTTILWDSGQPTVCPDQNFLHAAVLLIRVISKPTPDRLCFDLGHKAVASEMPHPRVQILELSDAKFVGHSEEHLVVETSRASEVPVGKVFYAIPRHVCPTVALHSEVVVVTDGRACDRWPVVARARRISI
jgi:D-serine deaminase-like pyridoxal phosphate-dependent protein